MQVKSNSLKLRITNYFHHRATSTIARAISAVAASPSNANITTHIIPN
ncbi:MAG: hypothetical protein HWQ42_08690 [Nostoc sp. JL23]|nr:hypothetical protein [Nostoc sp. JL23]